MIEAPRMPIPTAQLIDELVADETELGLQVAAFQNGEPVFQYAAGTSPAFEATAAMPIENSTLFPVFSVSKGITALVALRAAELGLLDLDRPISAYWPEFAQGGKHDLCLREVLLHESGLAALPPTATFEEFCDWTRMTDAIAAMPPANRGTPAYHALSYGWIVGETVRRALKSTQSFGDVMRELLLTEQFPDFWFGISDSAEPRIATVRRDTEARAVGHPLESAIPPQFGTTQSVFGRSDVRRACIPGAGGIGNASTIAQVYSRAAAGDLGAGVRSLASTVVSETEDALIGDFVARSVGFYASPTTHPWASPFTPGTTRFGHPGAGGSLAWADSSNGAGFAICRVRLTSDGWRSPSIQQVVTALESELSG